MLISSITLAELRFGIAKSVRQERNRERLELFLARFNTPPFDTKAAEVYGSIQAYLEAWGTPIGPLDTLIAAHNLSLDAVLVTHNTREFARVPRCRLKTDYHRNKQQ